MSNDYLTMRPETRKGLHAKVPARDVRKVFLWLALSFGPIFAYIPFSETKIYQFLFGGYQVFLYYGLVAVLIYVSNKRDSVRLQKAVDERMEGRPIAGPIWRVAKFLEIVASLAMLVFLGYLILQGLRS